MNQYNPTSQLGGVAGGRARTFGIVALAAVVAGSLTLCSSPVEAVLTNLTASATYNMGGSLTADTFYNDVAGVMFKVNAPAGEIPLVRSLGRFYWGVSSTGYPNVNGYTGPWPGDQGIRTLTLAKVTNPGLFSGTTIGGLGATVVATTTVDPTTAPITQQVTLNFGGGAIGGWQYTTLPTPVLLEQGATYILTATQYGYFQSTPTGQVYARPDGTIVPLNSDFTWVGGASAWNGSTFSALGNNFGISSMAGPVNLQYELVTPEPSTVMLLGVGGIMLRRRMRRA